MKIPHFPLSRLVTPWILGGCLFVAAWLVGRELGEPTPSAEQTKISADVVTPAERERAGAESTKLDRAQWTELIRGCFAEASSTRLVQRFFEITERLDWREFPALMEVLRAFKDDRGLRGELFEMWAERDFKSARAWFDAQPAADHTWLGPRLVSVWGRIDTVALGSWISTLPPKERAMLAPPHDTSWRELVGAIAERNAEAALDLLDKVPEVEPATYQMAIGALLRRDPAVAAARTLEMPTGEKKNAALDSLIYGWVKTDPVAALAWSEQLDDPKRAAWARYLASLSTAKGSAGEFEKALESLSPERQIWLLKDRASWLAQTSPEQAVDFAREQTDTKIREALIDVTVREMASADPTRAAELWLVETAQSGRVPGNGRDLFLTLADQQGVAGALRFLERLPPDQDGALKEATRSIAESAGWAAIADAATRMPAGARRTAWLQQAVEALTRDGDVSVVQKLIAQLPAGPDLDATVRVLAAASFPENPDVGGATLLRLSDGRKALGEEVQRWIKADAPEARRWISMTALLDAEEKAALLSTAFHSR